MTHIIIQGLLLSGLYALIAVGFTMIFSVGRVLNLAYGVYIMLGGYIYFQCVQVWHLPKAVGFVMAVAAGVAFAVATYQLLVRRLENNPVAVEISTLILAVVMQALIVMIYGAASRTMWPLVNGVWRIEGVAVTYNILIATVASWFILGGLMWFVHKTHLGRAIMAVSMDRKGAMVSGIDPRRISLITWAISGGLGAIAGVFFATYTQLDPSMWVGPLIIAVAVVVIGGIGSIVGSLIVAHLIGFMETITTSLLAAELRGVFTMLLIIIVLIVTPKGLFGREEL
ncbi:MAG: branched-chain amino acid ABC transporter permease [Alphaproteobacteria bacterium]|nr:branched-chain amino acid ABC transporter permease [Alphaproteobacteria bacterium]